MPEDLVTGTPTAEAPVVDQKPAEPVVSDAKGEAESKPTEEPTLLGKKSEEVKTEPPKTVPEKYEIKAPEGMELDEKALEAVTPVFKELGISQEGAQKLIDTYGTQVSAILQKQQEQAVGEFKKITDGWKQETIKELGVTADVEMAHAAKFIDKFGTDEVRKVLDDTGLGNNIHVVRMLIKAGKAFGQDSFPDPSSQKGVAKTEIEKAKALFPTMKE